jgi:hypothetical protein
MDGLYQDIVEIPSDEVWETRTSPTFFTVKNHSELALMRFWRGTGPKSGWAINGPGDWTMRQKGHVLMVSYPAMKAAVAGRVLSTVGVSYRPMNRMGG